MFVSLYVSHCLTTDMLSTKSSGTAKEYLAAQITAFPTVQLPEYSENLDFRGASAPTRFQSYDMVQAVGADKGHDRVRALKFST